MMEDKRDIENIAQEIMELVDDIILCDSTGYQLDCKRQIQFKLRELVERCSVREQDGYTLVPNEPTLAMRRAFDSVITEYIREDDDKFDDVYVIKSVISAAHNITNTNKE